MALYLILMGVQGAGKGVQAKYIREAYNLPHVSTGDLFRAMKTREDELALKVQDLINHGILVPDEITCEMVRDRLEQPDAADGVILDGFPRNLAQAEWLDNYLAEHNDSVSAAVLFDLDLFTAFKRAFGRVTGSESGASCNIYFDDEKIDWEFVEHPEGAYPPRLEAKFKDSGELLKRRADDASAHAVIERIETYQRSTQPLVDYYEDKGLLRKVNADQSIDDVAADVKKVIDAVK